MNTYLDWHVRQHQLNKAHVAAIREAREADRITEEHFAAVEKTKAEMLAHSR